MPSLAKVISKTPKKKLSISDWKWRPPGEVKAELGLTETPQHIQDFGQYMLEMAGKAKDKKLTARDLVKAYTITRSSIQRQATDVNNVIKAGLPLDPKMGKVRPEGAFSEWLGTPMGQRYLNAAEKGKVDEEAVADAVKIMAPFGKHEKDIPDALRWGAQNLPGRESQASDLVARAAEGSSSPTEWRSFAKGVKGIGPAKAGFWASLLGRGDLPTLDARQVSIHTGKPTSDSKQFISNKRLGDQAVDRLAKRQSDMAVPMPDELRPFYQHLTHHNVWDAAGGTKTTHADVVNAMKNYSIAAGLAGGGLGASAMFDNAEASEPRPAMPTTDDPQAWADFDAQMRAANAPSAGKVGADIGTQAVAGINRGVASLPGLPKDLAGLADWGLDAFGVSDNETLRNVINPGRMWPISGEDSIKAWESVAGDLPEAETDLGAVTDFLAQFVTPGPGELSGAMSLSALMALPANKRLVTLVDEAKRLGVEPKVLANYYSGIKYNNPKIMSPNATAPEDWMKLVEDVPSQTPVKRRPEGLIGRTVYSAPGDMASTSIVHGINGRNVNPAQPGGGPRFTVKQKRIDEGAVWAGAPTAATGAINKSKAITDAGGDPLMINTTMASDATDYNAATADLVLQDIQAGKKTKAERKRLNDFLLEKFGPNGPDKTRIDNFDPRDFPGIDTDKNLEKTRALLLNNAPGPHGQMRTRMVKAFDGRDALDMGAPEIGPIRFAIADPDFALNDAQWAGGSLFKVDPNGKAIPSDHGTYAASYPGWGEGELDGRVPVGYLMPDWVKTNARQPLKPDGTLSSNDWYTFGRQGPTQKITEEMVDRWYKLGLFK